VDRAKRGVVLIAFGSLVEGSALPAKLRDQFLAAFSRFPDHEFIWRYVKKGTEVERTIAERHRNVHLFDWVDQPSILGDFLNCFVGKRNASRNSRIILFKKALNNMESRPF
jgi:hypothetical protein